MSSVTSKPTLYDRLGGVYSIAAVVITCEQPNGVIARCLSGSHRPAQCDRDRR
jgi:hypothetical protein